MEEEKAAAYYDELTRKGEGAARFKQGLGFSSSGTDAVPERGLAIASSSSFLNQFVKASNPNSTEGKDKSSEIRSIRDKLNKKRPEDRQHSSVPDRSYRELSEQRRYRSRERDERDKSHRRRSRSRSRSAERHNSRYADRDRSRRSRRSRSRSSSPRRERRRSEDERRGRRIEDAKEKKIDYSRLIKGYTEMSAAEKVKAKMKLQLNETAEKDTSKGAGWERFEFDKDAPVDDEEVEEGTDDDAALVKRMGQSFRFSAIEARREEQVKAAHDEAMFGVPTRQTPNNNTDNDVTETTNVKDDEGDNNIGANLLSEKVLAKQQGSWRDRARRS